MNIRCTVMFLLFATLAPIRPEASLGDDAEPEMPERVKEMLRWLPSDTETLIVANGPFEIPARRNDSLTFADRLESLPVCTIASVLKSELQGHRIGLAIEGSRRFRSPSGLGLMPYQGCQIMRFDDSSDAALQRAMKSCFDRAREVIRLEEHQVAVFKEKYEDDDWTLLVTRPQRGLLLCATHRGFLEDVLQRIEKHKQERAFPASLPEWDHVDFQARVWAVRHYRKEESGKDPSSPFRPRAPANRPDANAVGFVFCYDAELKMAKVRYLSSAHDAVKIVSSGWYNPPENLTPNIEFLEPGVVEVSSSIADDKVGSIFLFVLMMYLGHGVYV